MCRLLSLVLLSLRFFNSLTHGNEITRLSQLNNTETSKLIYFYNSDNIEPIFLPHINELRIGIITRAFYFDQPRNDFTNILMQINERYALSMFETIAKTLKIE
jgi:hypothetical protein